MSAGLDGVYRDVLNRAPRSDEEGYYDDQLANGRFLADIRRELAYSPEARVDIDGLYQQILGRAADAGGMGYYEENLATGASTLGAILTELAHSPEAGGDIDAIYHQVAGRGASEEEIALYQGALGLGIGWTLGGVRWDISHSAPATAAIGGVYQQMLGHSWNDYNLLLAYEGNMGASWIQWTLNEVRWDLAHRPEATQGIVDLYQQILGRAPIQAEIDVYENSALSLGASLGDVRVALATSPEESADIDAIYRQVAGRGASDGEIALYEGALGLGIGWTLGGVRWDIAHSAPATAAINGIYQQMLGHSSNDDNLLLAYEANMGASWIKWTVNEVRWDLAHRPEATQGITGIYQQMLGRNPSAAEIGVYEDNALSLGASLDQVRYAVAHSPEARADFDAAYYLAQNPDVAAAGVDPYLHYLASGWREGRNPNAWFNTSYYLQQNPDVAAAGVNPLLHYRLSGWHEGRDPSAQFSTRAYLSAYGDVAAAGIDPLAHYIAYGRFEGRSAFAATPNATLAMQAIAINAFYYKMFARAALPTEMGAIQMAVNAGQTLAGVFDYLRPIFAVSATETAVINAFYQQNFQRDANSAELGNIEGALAAGQSLLDIEQLLHPTAPAQDAVVVSVNAFYQQLFGRNALAQEIDSFRAALATGQTLQQIETYLRPLFVYSSNEDALLATIYQQVTGNQADEDTIFSAEDAIYGGASVAEIRSDFAHSSDAGAAIDQLYRDVLGRGATATEITAKETLLATAATFSGIRSDLAHSSEEAQEIGQLYRGLFGHDVDPASLGIVQGQIAAGTKLSDYRRGFALDPNGQVPSEIDQLFLAFVNRNANPTELAYWQGRMADGLSLNDLNTTLGSYQGYNENGIPWVDVYENVNYDPATDKVNGYARAFTDITLVGADGAALAVNAARDLLALIPIYVTTYGGQTPNIRQANGQILVFDNAVQLANYLRRTASHTAAFDPLLGNAYDRTIEWLSQVAQPVLQAGIAMAQSYRYNTSIGNFDQAKLAQTASALAFQLAEEDPATRQDKIYSHVSVGGHVAIVSVYKDGTVNFHDIDPGSFAIIEAVITIIVDILAVFPPTSAVGVPLAIALHAAEAGQAFADGNIIGGVLNLAAAASFGLSELASLNVQDAISNATHLGFISENAVAPAEAAARQLVTTSEIIQVASRFTGGIYGIVHGAETGDAAGILGGVITTAAGVASGLGIIAASDPATQASALTTYRNIVWTLGAAGALTSFGNSVSHGDLEGGLLNSLAPWLAGLAADNIGIGTLSSSGVQDTLSGDGGQESYPIPTANQPNGTTYIVADPATTIDAAVQAAKSSQLVAGPGAPTEIAIRYAGRFLAGAAFGEAMLGPPGAIVGGIVGVYLSSTSTDQTLRTTILPTGTIITRAGGSETATVLFERYVGPVTTSASGLVRAGDGHVVGVELDVNNEYFSLNTKAGIPVGTIGLDFKIDSAFEALAKAGIVDIQMGPNGAVSNPAPLPAISPSSGTGTPDPDFDPYKPPTRVDPRATEKLNNSLSEYRTSRYQVDNQVFQLDRSDMTHIMERHSQEYWLGDSTLNQSFFRPNTTPSDIQSIVGDIISQNRSSIVSRPDLFQRNIFGNSGGLNYRVTIYQGRVTSLVPLR